MNSKRKNNNIEKQVYSSVKKRLAETWRGESVRSYATGNLTSLPEFFIDELAEEFADSIGRKILAQINAQPLEPHTRRNLQSQLKELLQQVKRDVKISTKNHLERFFQVY